MMTKQKKKKEEDGSEEEESEEEESEEGEDEQQIESLGSAVPTQDQSHIQPRNKISASNIAPRKRKQSQSPSSTQLQRKTKKHNMPNDHGVVHFCTICFNSGFIRVIGEVIFQL